MVSPYSAVSFAKFQIFFAVATAAAPIAAIDAAATSAAFFAAFANFSNPSFKLSNLILLVSFSSVFKPFKLDSVLVISTLNAL